MIRERISIRGIVRPLEPESDLQGLQLEPKDIGVIKEGPVKRYLEGTVRFFYPVSFWAAWCIMTKE